MSTSAEDAANPRPTGPEVVEYLKYMDDLDAIRRYQEAIDYFVPIQAVAFLLFVIGVFGGLVNPIFGGIAWAIMTATWQRFIKRSWVLRCPRCRSAYHETRRRASNPRKCVNCGLRALSQRDFRRTRTPAETDTPETPPEWDFPDHESLVDN